MGEVPEYIENYGDEKRRKRDGVMEKSGLDFITDYRKLLSLHGFSKQCIP
jgi:hypothetical protein